MNTYELIKKETISEPFKTPSLRSVLTFAGPDGEPCFTAIVPDDQAGEIKIGSMWTFEFKRYVADPPASKPIVVSNPATRAIALPARPLLAPARPKPRALPKPAARKK
jgi:hypothetical protein